MAFTILPLSSPSVFEKYSTVHDSVGNLQICKFLDMSKSAQTSKTFVYMNPGNGYQQQSFIKQFLRKTFNFALTLVFIAESVDIRCNLAPLYKTVQSSLAIRDCTRGISVHYDPIVANPNPIDFDPQFDIITTIVDDVAIIAGYRNHNHDKREFVKKLSSIVQFYRANENFLLTKFIVMGDFNMHRNCLLYTSPSPRD